MPTYPKSTTTAPRTSLAATIAAVAATAVAIWLVTHASPGLMTNDAGQYISTIDGILAGRGITTTALYYEVQAAGGLPAPQTVWPPGLSLAAAAVSAITGQDAPLALVTVNVIAHAATVVLLAWLLARLVGIWPAALIAALYAVYPPGLRMVLIGASEPLFTAFALAATASLLTAYRAATPDRRWLIAASALVGAACLVRYHGIALIGALGLVALASWIAAGRTRRTLGDGIALLAPATLIFVALLARNYSLTGKLTGGPAGPRALTPSELVEQSIWGIVEILGGDSGRWGRIAAALLFVSLAALLVQGLAARLRTDRAVAPERWRVSLFAASASAGMIALVLVMALRPTGVKIEGRYFIPCIPLMLVAIAALWPAHRVVSAARPLSQLPAIGVTAAALALIAIGHTGLRSWLANGNEPSVIERALAAPYEGRTLRAHLTDATSDGTPILSNQSQALYTVLRRPTIGVPERRLTPAAWQPDAIIAHARKFGSKRLVIFTRLPLGEADGSSDFVFQIPGRAPPGARLLFHNDDVLVYDITKPNS